MLKKVSAIIEEYGSVNGNQDINECVTRIESLMKENNIKQYIVSKDEDVFDGRDVAVYYVAVTWIDGNNLHLCGGPVYNR